KPEPRRRFVPIDRSPTTLEARPRAPTDPDNVRGALREIAEALLDRGIDDTRLVTGIAHLQDHERALARLEAAQDALEHESAAVRETVGDRESSLRFALGELELARGDAEQIRELEARLAAATADGDRLRALEQGIAQVAGLRAQALDRLKVAYDALEGVVETLLAGREAGFEAVSERFAAVRARRRPG
ncbi:MAG: hypothetical protein ACM31C_06800, partial [Acidobacteriota bacterium]